MASLEQKGKRRNYSSYKSEEKPCSKRFYTSLDMAIIKHDVAVKNSQEKRGEIKRTNNRGIYPCGCGIEGCFIHSDH